MRRCAGREKTLSKAKTATPGQVPSMDDTDSKDTGELCTINALRDELRAKDQEVYRRIQQWEQWFNSLRTGVPIKLGGEYHTAKLNHQWRFIVTATGTPVLDTPRLEKAQFLAKWGTAHALSVAVERGLRAALLQRNEVLNTTTAPTTDGSSD